MVFSSLIFLFLFLPITLATNFIPSLRVRNAFLLAFSLFFYAWGEIHLVLLMALSIIANYGLCLWMDTFNAAEKASQRKSVLAITIALNLLALITFKYSNFIIDNLNVILTLAGLNIIHLAPVRLPIGISFYTFQAMSYVLDVYRNDVKVQKNPLNLGLYISLFPQLIAGPIVRYSDIALQLMNRTINFHEFAHGVKRFIIGLGKKVIIANYMGELADGIFNIPGKDLSCGVAWLGVLAYAFQIYFDFSGYSDMAIGLGKMIGFDFLENFNYPYVSRSIQMFWRKWHISLSTWFRDYLYIPLGGSRGSVFRTYINLTMVFFLCGLWHGASWNFVLWGLFHGVFLVAERFFLLQLLEKIWTPLHHVYTLLVVLAGWVLFRAETLSQAGDFFASMSGFGPSAGTIYHFQKYITTQSAMTFILAAAFSMPVAPFIRSIIKASESRLSGGQRLSNIWVYAYPACEMIGCCAILLVSILNLANGTYNPFIYYRF